MKKACTFLLLFVSIFGIAQKSPDLPFSISSPRTSDSIIQEIVKVLNVFDSLKAKKPVKTKFINDEPEQGRVIDIYLVNNKMISISRYYPWGNEGTRTLYFDSLERIRLVVDFCHGMSSYNSYYYYIGTNTNWCFSDASEDLPKSNKIPLRKKLLFIEKGALSKLTSGDGVNYQEELNNSRMWKQKAK